MGPETDSEKAYRINNVDYVFRKLLDLPSAPCSPGDGDMLQVPAGVLTKLSDAAFHDLSFYLRSSHLEALAAAAADPASGERERYVCRSLIRNAAAASGGEFPLCQDTGTAVVSAWKGDRVFTGNEDDEAALAAGIENAYKNNSLRFSQIAPLSMFEEVNTGSNLPAQIDIHAVKGDRYTFLFTARGAGSSNKTAFYQKTRALLFPAALESFLREQAAALGADACPPYHIAVVVGGSSPERNLYTLKLAVAGWLDGLPRYGDRAGRAFRDPAWEEKVMKIAAETGVGAQFGGRHTALAARVIRLPRHGGSCPVSVGVSCNAHRHMAGLITHEGVFLEKLDRNPARFLAMAGPATGGEAADIDLEAGMDAILARLRGLAPGTMLNLTGTLTVARDMAHAAIWEMLRKGGDMPAYMREHPVCYAGPARTPPGRVTGSFGPTTSRRMDCYAEAFMKRGASLVSVGKGGRCAAFAGACSKYGGFYLGLIGGAAALNAGEHVTSCSIIDFPEFGMEAVYRVVVQNLPAFLLCNDRGETFYG